ncbi:response regulator [Sphingomonas sp. LB-2]|uniref:response regulator transcription factor n=1 Tax=Sphingomonas caeni TaxID=2984949 RepID=UPI00222F6738|nr:response regulator [Sphingomonas caeni]MCW3847933.1 response regulator [Sphingomonas caeni]
MRFIYIVDDDRISRRFIQQAVSGDTGTVVRMFENGLDFLREADDLDPGVLLLDLNMPQMDGVEVLEKLDARGDSKFMTVLVTGSASVQAAVLAMKYGAADVIEKPFENGTLGDALTVAFGRLEACKATAALTRDARRKIEALSPRERDVLYHLFDGCANKVTAGELGISPRTVEIYRAGAMKKLGVQNLAHAVRIAVVAGWVPVQTDNSQAGA